MNNNFFFSIPSKESDHTILKEIVYEVQKIQENWIGEWNSQGFVSKMLIIIGQITPIVEYLVLL